MIFLKTKPIYVEIPIIADIEDVWQASQIPHLHSQWDLRFSSITYLPKQEDAPQEFTYTRSVPLLLKIEGWGRSVGSFHKEDGTRSSSLHFGTDQRISPIKEGKGYWKYEPNENGVTFLTQYDYSTNFGLVGKIVDRLAFRPLIGWATALSFDVLKRWLEKGEPPHAQYIRFFSTYLLTLFFAFIWIYQGLVPKLIGMHPQELTMISNALSLPESQLTFVVISIGVAEVLFGLFWLFFRRKKILFTFQMILFPFLTIAALLTDPATAIHPFNPVTFNLSLVVLSILGVLVSKDVPTATSCKRKK